MLYEEQTEKIIKAFYDVYNGLGYGFLEKVYENALRIELQKMGLNVVQQQPIRVYYNGEVVGEYFADLIVERKVILELKAVKKIGDQHVAQLINYLKATDAQVGLILNFGPEPTFARKIFTNEGKKKRPKKSA